MTLHYDYTAAKDYCENVCGLVWMPQLLAEADAEANNLGMTQQQVDAMMRHHMWQVKLLFTPENYNWIARIILAFYFLTGWKPKVKK